MSTFAWSLDEFWQGAGPTFHLSRPKIAAFNAQVDIQKNIPVVPDKDFRNAISSYISSSHVFSRLSGQFQ